MIILGLLWLCAVDWPVRPIAMRRPALLAIRARISRCVGVAEPVERSRCVSVC